MKTPKHDVVVLGLLTCALLAASPAEPPFSQVLAEAAAAKQPVLLDVYATWCQPCRRLERAVFPDPMVRRALSAYRFQRYDAERGEGIAVAKRYDVRAYPTLLVVNPDGVQIAQVRQHEREGLARALAYWAPLGAIRGTFHAPAEVEAHRSDAGYQLVLGLIYDRSGQLREARQCYEQAERLDPGNARGFAARAAFQLLRQQLRPPLPVPNQGALLIGFARRYPGTEMAARTIEALRDLPPGMRPSAQEIAEAGQAARAGLAAKKDHLALNALAWSFVDLGQPELALQAAQDALAASPYQLNYVLTTAAAQHRLGKRDAALQTLGKGLQVDPKHAGLAAARIRVQQRQPLDRATPTWLFDN